MLYSCVEFSLDSIQRIRESVAPLPVRGHTGNGPGATDQSKLLYTGTVNELIKEASISFMTEVKRRKGAGHL